MTGISCVKVCRTDVNGRVFLTDGPLSNSRRRVSLSRLQVVVKQPQVGDCAEQDFSRFPLELIRLNPNVQNKIEFDRYSYGKTSSGFFGTVTSESAIYIFRTIKKRRVAVVHVKSDTKCLSKCLRVLADINAPPKELFHVKGWNFNESAPDNRIKRIFKKTNFKIRPHLVVPDGSEAFLSVDLSRNPFVIVKKR